jgi:hypothetical protein
MTGGPFSSGRSSTELEQTRLGYGVRCSPLGFSPLADGAGWRAGDYLCAFNMPNMIMMEVSMLVLYAKSNNKS